VELQLHVFFNLSIIWNWVVNSTLPDALSPEERSRDPLHRGLGGPQSQPERVAKNITREPTYEQQLFSIPVLVPTPPTIQAQTTILSWRLMRHLWFIKTTWRIRIRVALTTPKQQNGHYCAYKEVYCNSPNTIHRKPN